MTRQHATPVLIAANGEQVPLAQLALTAGADQVSEATIQALAQAHPGCLPIAEIDPLFLNPVPICTELNTQVGPIDNLLITATELPVLVECKLWRNPEGRREVVGQILDYAKELSRWTSSDLQREVSRRLKREGNVLLELVRAAGHEVDEIGFNDAVTLNLRRGRFLLLIVGDGIREGVEAIAEYLQAHAGLHFTLGLVEMPIFATDHGDRFVAPRVLARTVTISREVIAVPNGYFIKEADGEQESQDLDEATVARLAFLKELVAGTLNLDPDQPSPKPSPRGYLSLYMPAPANSCWISVSVTSARVGLWLTSNVGTPGEAAIRAAVQDWSAIHAQLGTGVKLRELKPGRYVIEEFLPGDPYATPAARQVAIGWLRSRMREFVAVLRPRIRDALADLTGS